MVKRWKEVVTWMELDQNHVLWQDLFSSVLNPEPSGSVY
jgi:hypothetical protein